MKNWLSRSTKLAALCATAGMFICAATAQEASPLTVQSNDGHAIHILPTTRMAPALPPDVGPLVYHGGPVMQAGNTLYAIFWVPAKLQNGGATSMTAHYQSVENNLLRDYPAHGIDNINTQYYHTTATNAKQFIQHKGTLCRSYVDNDPYTASGYSVLPTP